MTQRGVQRPSPELRRGVSRIFRSREVPARIPRAEAAMLAQQSRAAQKGSDGELATVYKIAFDEAVRTLKAQADELSTMRQRLVQYLAFVGTATAFLVGTSLRPSDGAQPILRGPEFMPLCIAGTVAMVVTLVLALILLYPGWTRLTVVSSSKGILAGIHRDVSPTDTEAHLLHDLAWYYGDYINKNKPILARSRWIYFAGIGAGAIQLGIWIALIWTQVNATQ